MEGGAGSSLPPAPFNEGRFVGNSKGYILHYNILKCLFNLHMEQLCMAAICRNKLTEEHHAANIFWQTLSKRSSPLGERVPSLDLANHTQL